MAQLRARFIRQIMPEVVDELVKESSREALQEGNFRLAVAPQVTVRPSLEELVRGDPLTYEMSFEVMPSIALDFSKVKVTRFTCHATQEDLAKVLKDLGERHRAETPKRHNVPAQKGDVVYVDFTGRLKGTVVEGGEGDNVRVLLGSGQMVKDFEKGLEGVVGGEKRDFEVVFPETHGTLGGKTVSFAVAVHRVMSLSEPSTGEALAKVLGCETVEEMHKQVQERCVAQDKQRSRALLKEQLVTVFSDIYDFALPETLVKEEVARIVKEVGDKDEVRVLSLAKNRVRVGILVSEIAYRHNLVVTDEEFSSAARVLGESYLKSEAALRVLRGSLLEEKVVDFVLERVTVEEKEVSRDVLYSGEVLDA